MRYLLARMFFTASLTLTLLVLVSVGEASRVYPSVALAIWGILSLVLWLGFMATYSTRRTHAQVTIPILLSAWDLRDRQEQEKG